MQNQSSLILASQQSAARSLSLKDVKEEVITLEKSVVFMDGCDDELDGEAD